VPNVTSISAGQTEASEAPPGLLVRCGHV